MWGDDTQKVLSFKQEWTYFLWFDEFGTEVSTYTLFILLQFGMGKAEYSQK